MRLEDDPSLQYRPALLAPFRDDNWGLSFGWLAFPTPDTHLLFQPLFVSTVGRADRIFFVDIHSSIQIELWFSLFFWSIPFFFPIFASHRILRNPSPIRVFRLRPSLLPMDCYVSVSLPIFYNGIVIRGFQWPGLHPWQFSSFTSLRSFLSPYFSL